MSELECHPLAPYLNRRCRYMAVYVVPETKSGSRIAVNPTFKEIVIAETGQLVLSSATLPYNSAIAALDLADGDIVAFDASLRGHMTHSLAFDGEESKSIAHFKLMQPTHFEKIGRVD